MCSEDQNKTQCVQIAVLLIMDCWLIENTAGGHECITGGPKYMSGGHECVTAGPAHITGVSEYILVYHPK